MRDIRRPLKPQMPRLTRRSLAQLVMRFLARWFLILMLGGRRFGYHAALRDDPYLILCNHQSHLDPPLLGAAFPGLLAYMAKDSLFRGPGKFIMPLVGAFPIRRDGSERNPTQGTRTARDENRSTVVFGEGTRSADGEVHDLMPGITILPQRLRMGVLIAAIDGTFYAYPTKTSPLRLTPHPVFFDFSEYLPPDELRRLKRDAGDVMHGKLVALHAKTRERWHRAGPGITTLAGVAWDLLLAVPRILLLRTGER